MLISCSVVYDPIFRMCPSGHGRYKKGKFSISPGIQLILLNITRCLKGNQDLSARGY